MTINKFTLAVALSIGLLASTSYAGFTEDLTTDASSSTLAACPLSGCPTPVTPQTATCPSCLQDTNSCSCPKPSCDSCDPCEKAAAPCDCDPCECDPCEKAQTPCDDNMTGAACPCPPADPCPQMQQCPQPSPPACAVCPQPDNGQKFKQQVYAYPNAIYGDNQVIGERNNGLFLGDDAQATACSPSGIPVANSECGCQSGATTGAASPIPCMNNAPCANGISVDRNPMNIDGSCCPVQIHTNSSVEVLQKSLVPFEVSTPTGAAVPLVSSFDDVPSGFWAGCDINKLAENSIIAGYPDRTFKPNLPVSRAEMATMIVKGLNLNDKMTCPEKVFKDVPENFWANKTINKAVSNGMMCGYPNDLFKPNEPLNRAEAFTILSKGINCPMDDCKAGQILSQYCDGDSVPSWAKIPIAKALEVGAMADSPQPNMISPNKDASRAEIANMLENVRVALGYSKDDVASTGDCGCTGAAAYMEKESITKVPTLQLCFSDEINSKSAHVGDQFAAKTIDEVTIDGVCYPAGSMVRGKVLEVVRPTKNCQGALRLSFNTIQNGDCKADLPNQILTAQVNQIKKPNGFMRAIEFPFTWTGGLLGDVGRTVGGAIISASNAVDNTINGVGVATGELFTGQFRAAGRSYQDVGKQIVTAPVDVTRTALSGTMGLFQYTGDELTYLVDPKGMKVSSINPKEKVTIAFGCHTQK
ncbi:MAG: S-layer homology domain-containing protein [Candidatus Gastranaerophilales bacterium]|nr:S-layer homology domain-containing protein [Candidatus Gastranaerophilales bacterium]